MSPTCFGANCTILREKSCHFLKTVCLLYYCCYI